MKRCGRCKQEKDVSEFGVQNAVTGKLQSYCKTCAKESSRLSYALNLNEARSKNHTRNKTTKAFNRKKN